jgi:hypothetical protein
MSTARQVGFVLAKPQDWDGWLQTIQRQAMKNGINVWDMIDPSQDVPQAEPKEPERPVREAAESMEIYALRRSNYKDKMAAYEKKIAVLDSITTYIQEHISIPMHTFIMGQMTAYDMLRALRRRLAPTDEAREWDIEQRYKNVLKPPKDQDIHK